MTNYELYVESIYIYTRIKPNIFTLFYFLPFNLATRVSPAFGGELHQTCVRKQIKLWFRNTEISICPWFSSQTWRNHNKSKNQEHNFRHEENRFWTVNDDEATLTRSKRTLYSVWSLVYKNSKTLKPYVFVIHEQVSSNLCFLDFQIRTLCPLFDNPNLDSESFASPSNSKPIFHVASTHSLNLQLRFWLHFRILSSSPYSWSIFLQLLW